MDLFHFLRAFLTLFIITDPLGNLPLFLSLTSGQGEKKRKQTLRIALVTGFVILLMVSLLGTWILSIFHISLTDFKIAGGFLLFVISILILIEGRWRGVEGEEVGAVPLGCPLLVGPGAITSAIVLIGEYGLNITLLAVIADFAVIWLMFRFSDVLYRYLGDTGAKIISKIMAIMIAAIAIKYIREGLFETIMVYMK